jgi:hypothetical protein
VTLPCHGGNVVNSYQYFADSNVQQQDVIYLSNLKPMRHYLSILWCAFLMFPICGGILPAQTDQPVMWYQGVLLDKQSRPKPDAKYNFVFQVFDDQGVILGQPVTRDSLQVVNGTFGVGIPLSTFDANKSGNYWLQVTVNGEVLTPRIRIGAVPYALRAKYADIGAVTADEPIQVMNKAEGGFHVQFSSSYIQPGNGLQLTQSPDGQNITVSLDSASLAALAGLKAAASEGNVLRYTPAGWAPGSAPSDAPVGTVISFAGDESSIPDRGRWMVCDGSSHSTSALPELYSVIKNKYGGTSSDFKLPDYRGVFLRMIDKTSAGARGRDEDGSRSVGDAQDDATGDHEHSYSIPNAGWDLSQVCWAGCPGGGGAVAILIHNNLRTAKGTTGGVVPKPKESRPKNVGILYLIKVKP